MSCAAHARSVYARIGYFLVPRRMEITKDFVGLSVGDTFATFDALAVKLKHVQHETYVQLYMRDSRTMEAAKKRMPKIAAKANSLLRYHSIQYSCVSLVFRQFWPTNKVFRMSSVSSSGILFTCQYNSVS